MSVFPPPMTHARASNVSVSAIAISACLLLSACGNGAFVDRRRDAGNGTLTFIGQSTPDAPSICYNSWNATPAQVIAMANAVCAKSGRVAVLHNQSTMDCRLLYPARTDFRCVEPGDPATLGVRP